MSSPKSKWLRNKLFKENPYCPKCGVKMIRPESLPIKDGKREKPPDNTCMIVRRFTAYDKFERMKNKKPATIMCFKCLQELDKKRQSEVPIEIRHLKAHKKEVIKHTRY